MPIVTFTFDTATLARILKAFGVYLRLGRDATAWEGKEYLGKHVAGTSSQMNGG